jgi:DNA processing protein
MEELRYLLALSMIQFVGSITARKLIAYAGSAEAVFKLGKEKLQMIPGIGEILSSRTGTPGLLEKADKEIEFCRKNNIIIVSFYNKEYPARLKQCVDAPLILFYRGSDCFNALKVLSFVGTRRATNYGTDQCNKLIREIAVSHPDTLIISGLAYGIDFNSHVAALKNGLKTVAVLGHGLHTIYPYAHKNLAVKIIENGCICSDFSSDMEPERNNFIKRNRIIAGLSDATIVVESANKGGALITADIAASYNRDVFAVPGRTGDEMSGGCNQLIKSNKAGLIEDYRDIEYFMGWDSGNRKGLARQKLLFTELSKEEELIVSELKKEEKISMNDLSIISGISLGKMSNILLNLEFEGIISVLPGNYYRLN